MKIYFIIVKDGFEKGVSFNEWDVYEGEKFMRGGTGKRLTKTAEKIMAEMYRAGVYEE